MFKLFFAMQKRQREASHGGGGKKNLCAQIAARTFLTAGQSTPLSNSGPFLGTDTFGAFMLAIKDVAFPACIPSLPGEQ